MGEVSKRIGGRDPPYKWAQTRQTNPISGSPAATGGQNVRNEPNFAPSAREWARADRTGRPRRGPIAQNKPNLARLGQGQVPGGGKMQNEPNLTGRPGPRRTKRAKRTQFRSGPWPRHSHYSCIPPFQHSSPMPIVQNKANLRRHTVRLVIAAAPGYHGDVPMGISRPGSKKV